MSSFESLEEKVFKTLSNQKRRDIVRVIGENKEATFTNIKDAVQIEDSSILSYHLNVLEPLIISSNGKYQLSDLGKDSFNLIYKTSTYTGSNIILSGLRRELPAVIIANAILWAAAIFTVSHFSSDVNSFILYSFSILWFISNTIIYSVFIKIRTSHSWKNGFFSNILS